MHGGPPEASNCAPICVRSRKLERQSEKLIDKIDSLDERLSAKIDRPDERLSGKLDALAEDPTEHRWDTEAHKGGYKAMDE